MVYSICRKLFGDTSSKLNGNSESTISGSSAAKVQLLDPAVLKSYVVIDCQLLISDALPCPELSIASNHRSVEQPLLEEGSDQDDSASEANDSLALPTGR